MNDITHILNEIEQGRATVSDDLFPVVYEELRRLAVSKFAAERKDQTLQPTALVHEAFLRLVNVNEDYPWQNKAHFFAAASEAMRRILVDRARLRAAQKRGGELQRVPFDSKIEESSEDNILEIDEGLIQLEKHDSLAANIVKLRFFAGLSHSEAAEVLGVSRGVADRRWRLARAWLYKNLK